MAKPRRSESPETCPNCGADVPEGALACPECGADEETGWSDDAVGQRLGISDPDDFDHDAWEREESGRTPQSPRSRLWWVTALILLVLSLAGFAIHFLHR